ncbi:MAG: hypothetical protein ACREJC_07035, partial [Tepidisphaeraceae bacterium]
MWAITILVLIVCPSLEQMRVQSAQPSLADLILRHPPQFRVSKTGLEQRFVAAGDLRIEAVVRRSPGAQLNQTPRAFVLEFTGNGNLAEQVVRWVADGIWNDRAVEVWGFNYPGFGS